MTHARIHDLFKPRWSQWPSNMSSSVTWSSWPWRMMHQACALLRASAWFVLPRQKRWGMEILEGFCPRLQIHKTKIWRCRVALHTSMVRHTDKTNQIGIRNWHFEVPGRGIVRHCVKFQYSKYMLNHVDTYVPNPIPPSVAMYRSYLLWNFGKAMLGWRWLRGSWKQI